MNAKVQKWGNSLAVRIPQAVAKKLHLGQGSAVQVALNHSTNQITITPQKGDELDELLTRITKQNLHHEEWLEDQFGNEQW